MSNYKIVRIMDLVESVGEEAVKDILSDFSCEYREGIRNNEVEDFLYKNAVDFSKKKNAAPCQI